LRWIDLLGYAASLAVLATFCMHRMVPLRLVAIGSNVLFALFGALAHIYPILLLHVVLLPINIRRLLQSMQFSGRVLGAPIALPVKREGGRRREGPSA